MSKFWATGTCAEAMAVLMLQCGMQFLTAAVTHFLGVSSLNSGRIRQRCGSLSLGTADQQLDSAPPGLGVRAKPSGRPPSIGERVSLPVRPPRLMPIACARLPFATGSRAMRLHLGAVEQRLRHRAAGFGQRDEHLPSHALCCPANMPVVQGLGWPVDRLASFHRRSDFSTCVIPLITRRSSTRGTPRGLFGSSSHNRSIDHRSARTPTPSRSSSQPRS